MASKPSRWAATAPTEARKAQPKRSPDQKRRRAHNQFQRVVERNFAAAGEQKQSDGETDETPSKRRRTTPSTVEDAEEGATIRTFPYRTFPHRTFGPSSSVDKYELLNNIEEGSYGKVYRARVKSSGTIVALKKLKLDTTTTTSSSSSYSSDGFPITGLREIHTLRCCSHPHIVSLHEVVTGPSLSDIYLVLCFIEHDLKSLLSSLSEPFLPSEIKTLMLQLTSATTYLHSHYILHRDLKTSNILLTNRGELKLADFGMARFTAIPPPPNLTQLVVTLWYRAPELLLGTRSYSFDVDIWSLGCIFAELLTLEPLFPGKNEVDQLSLIFALLGTPTNESWPGFRSLPHARALHPVLSKTAISSKLTASKFPYLTTAGMHLLSSLLSLDPTCRPTADKVLESKYFSEDPRPKPKEMFPTFPSKAGQEKRRKIASPQAPARGSAPKIEESEVADVFSGRGGEEMGTGLALKMR